MRNTLNRTLGACLLLAAVLTLITPSRAQAPMRKLAFYEVRTTSATPNEDGTLPETAWTQANAARTYYEYWKGNPGFGELKSEFRMLYDDGGIHLKITNYEAQLDKIRATVTSRDDPQLWTDDCAQIYFDPLANGVGYVNFTVNSLGTQSDMKRMDAAVILSDWSGTQWHAVTKKTDGAWIIEAFFPWPDLGKKAKQGDIWMFDHVRFAWGTGKYIGVTWAPGGNYASPTKFGYLHFAGKEELSPLITGQSLSKIAQAPWVLPMETGLLMCSATGEISFSGASDTIAKYRADLQKAVDHALIAAANDQDAKQKIAALRDGTATLKYGTSAEALETVGRIAEATSAVNEMYWRSSTRNLIDRMVGKGETP